MDGIGHDSGITSKLNTLLRLGLVSKNNIRRAAVLFQDPDKAMKNPAYRMLMQEILVDVVDRVLNNRNLYTALRTSLSKESNITTESVEGERTKTLLRSGLVKKKDVIVARRALQSPETAVKMGASKVYRDLMIDMMDSMVKKITGSPVLFNAFRKTLGGETVEESFETPNTESMDEFGLVEAAQELMEKNKPTNPELWSQAKSKARAKFDVYPSAYANGWAVKWYNEQGGDWKSVSEGKTFFALQNELNEYMTTMNRKSPKPKPVKEASEVTEIYRITPARRAALDKIKSKATSDANRVTDEDDYSSKGLRDSKIAHARMRRVDLIKMMGKPSDKRTAEEHPDLKYNPKNSTSNQLKDRELKADLKHARKIERPIVKKKVNEASEVTAKLQGLKADYAKHAEELRKPIPPARGSTNPMARMGKGKKMEWAKDRRTKETKTSQRRRSGDADYRSTTTTD
jgi:hypothetical protein